MGSDDTLTPEEETLVKAYDSCLYGFINWNNPAENGKRKLILKAVNHYNNLIQSNGQTIPSKVNCILGHLYLLLEEHAKALQAYQKYYKIEENNWKDVPFLYGLGLVYLYFNVYPWACRALQQVLYADPEFCRAKEVHLRLGLIHKRNAEFESALKHFRLALNDSGPCTLSSIEIQVQIAHLFELQEKHKEAREQYEVLLKKDDLTPPLKALVLRHLGWLLQYADSLGDKTARQAQAVNCLLRSIELDPSSGLTWYYLGRCYSALGKVHDAFSAYRQSIDKWESSADTWCSIGVLYQLQNQPMDALQAYVCAVQLDTNHTAAWTDLGILYETCGQPKDALTCYISASKTKNANISTSLQQRIKMLQSTLQNVPDSVLQKRPRVLPTVSEAWQLPIPTELTSRQANNLARGQQAPGEPMNKRRRLIKDETTVDSSSPVHSLQQPSGLVMPQPASVSSPPGHARLTLSPLGRAFQGARC